MVLVACSRRTHLVRASPSTELMATVRTSCVDPSRSEIIEPWAIRRSMSDRTWAAAARDLLSVFSPALPTTAISRDAHEYARRPTRIGLVWRMARNAASGSMYHGACETCTGKDAAPCGH